VEPPKAIPPLWDKLDPDRRNPLRGFRPTSCALRSCSPWSAVWPPCSSCVGRCLRVAWP